jgi:heterodisulfide reductase subunit C
VVPPKEQDTKVASESAPKMSESILRELEGGHILEDLDVCYQCGTCSGGCPVARIVPEYNIRRIIKDAREGKIDTANKFLWFCSTCYLCYERCPQDVKPIQIVHRITNLVSKKRCAPTPVKEGNRGILATGRIVEVSRLTQQKRKQLGLPELKLDVSADFKKIAKLTGLEKMVK